MSRSSRRATPSSAAERLLLDVCHAVHEATGGRHYRYAVINDVHARLPRLTLDQLDAAIAVAAERHLVDVGGRPPHSMMLKEDGWRAIARWRAEADS